MSRRALLPLTLLCCAAMAQQNGSRSAAADGISLRDTLASPMAYVAIDASRGGEEGEANPLLSVLLSPALGSAETGPFALVRGLLARARGQVELALLSVLPSSVDAEAAGTPLVVLRTQLGEAERERMAQLLADPRIARPERTVEGQQTYGLVAAAGAPARRPIEVVLVGRDLVVANFARGLEEALDRSTTSASRCLRDDPRFQRLVAELKPGPGALLVFADWPRCAPRLAAIEGVPGALLDWSGLGGADAVAAAVMPHKLDKRPAEKGERAFRSQILLSMPSSAPVDGWLSTVTGTSARQMLDDVPVGGLGGFVVAVEPERLVNALVPPGGAPSDRPPHDHDREGGREPRGGHRHPDGFGHRLRGGCEGHGLDLTRIVQRLGDRGSMQMLLVAAGQELAPAFALQTKSKKAAADIVQELERALEPEGRRADGRSAEPIELRDFDGHGHLRLAAVEDWLVFAQDREAIEALAAARRDRQKVRPQLDASVQRAVRVLAGERGDRHGGLVHLDLRSWFERLGVISVGGDRELRSDSELGLPCVHTGFVDVEAETEGRPALVRLHLLSTH